MFDKPTGFYLFKECMCGYQLNLMGKLKKP